MVNKERLLTMGTLLLSALIFLTVHLSVPALAQSLTKMIRSGDERLDHLLEETVDYALGLRLRRSTPLYKRFFGRSLGGQHITEQITKFPAVRFDHFPDSRTSLAEIYPPEGTLVFTPNFFRFFGKYESKLLVLGIMLHESRHLEEPFGEHHIPCPPEDLAGEPLISRFDGLSLESKISCDNKLNGAYGFEAVFLNNVARFCTTCSSNDKELALRFSKKFLSRIVDQQAYQAISDDFKN